jgi:hypothetical protein
MWMVPTRIIRKPLKARTGGLGTLLALPLPAPDRFRTAMGLTAKFRSGSNLTVLRRTVRQ